jgi:hypothetical protein
MLSAIILAAVLPGFVQVPPPSQADLRAASFGSRDFSARFRGAALDIHQVRGNPRVPFRPDVITASLGYYGTQPSEVVHSNHAWFLAFYHGEFGGALWEFTQNGTVGRQLLGAPAYDLIRYGNDVLAATGSAAPFFFKPLRIHRYALRAGEWQEVSHIDFSYNIVDLTDIGGELFGIAATGPETQTLAQIHWNGSIAPLWAAPPRLYVSTIAMAPNGDMAIGARGYVIELRRHGSSFQAQWYAPRDCIRYTENSDDTQALVSHCIAAAGSAPFAKVTTAPASVVSASRDGTLILSQRPQSLLRFAGGKWHQIDTPGGRTYSAVEDWNGTPVLASYDGLWAFVSGRWAKIGSPVRCTTPFSFNDGAAWCGSLGKSDSTITGIRFDGQTVAANVMGVQPQLVFSGNSGDAWFTAPAAPVIGHVLPDGSINNLKTSHPVTQISVGPDALWFVESDKQHYGFVDRRNKVHEFAWRAGFPVLGIISGPAGAWLEESFSPRTTMLRYITPDNPVETSTYLPDIRSALITPGGTVYATSAAWPAILQYSPQGALSSFKLPCSEAYLRLLPAPNDGLWFSSRDPGCSGLIEGSRITVRDFPVLRSMVYK